MKYGGRMPIPQAAPMVWAGNLENTHMRKQTISEGVVHKLPPDLKKALAGDKAALGKTSRP